MWQRAGKPSGRRPDWCRLSAAAHGPAYNNWRGGYAGYHQGWTNGYWHGYHNSPNWNWGSFALGAATGVTAWGLGSSLYSWAMAATAAMAVTALDRGPTTTGAGRTAGYHQGWANGYWHGYHNSPYWNWGSFALGAAAGVTAWGLGSAFYSWGYASYANPYYSTETVAQPIVIEQTVAGGVPQSVTVPAVSYDYSRPIDTQAPPPEPAVADPAVAKFDEGRAAFKAGDYVKALQNTDEAIKSLPNDATLHEFRALALFALQKYEQAAVPLYAVLSVGPGWDWTTLDRPLSPRRRLYPAASCPGAVLRGRTPDRPPLRFVLAYHYLTQGNNDAAVAQFRQVQTLAPGDTLSAQLLKQLSPPEETPAPAATSSPAAPPSPAKQGNLAGRWTAKPNAETAIDLGIKDDGTFSWTVTTRGKPQVIAGDWSLTGSVLTLAQANQGSALVGNITWQAEDRFQFRALGTTADDPGLLFTH